MIFDAEKALILQLKEHAQNFQDTLKKALRGKEEELIRKFGRNFDERLTQEKCLFKEQLAKMIGRLKGMDDAMKGNFCYKDLHDT